jgi:molecular chaperone GrpE (heat shock protein)
MSEATEVETDFSAVMQELSAEAAATVAPTKVAPDESSVALGISALISAVHSLGQRIETLEESVMQKFDGLQLEKLEEQLAAIRDTESVNQKLFDSLHQELNSYRDSFVRDSLQKPFIRDLLVLFDDLSTLVWQFGQAVAADPDRQDKVQARDNLGNMLHFLVEILHRLEVTEVEQLAKVDFKIHKVIGCVATDSAEDDGGIVMRAKQGFMWRGQLLRPEEVIVRRFE